MTTMKERRSRAAKKAWQTRRRMAKPSPAMLKWLTWLAERQRVIVQRMHSEFGAFFSFGTWPEAHSYGLRLYPPKFMRTVFFALRKRKWIEMFHETKERECGSGWDYKTDSRIKHYEYRRLWRISDKGRWLLADQQTKQTLATGAKT